MLAGNKTGELICLYQLIYAGKGEAIRIRAILRSLIPLDDLQGVIGIPFRMPTLAKGESFGLAPPLC